MLIRLFVFFAFFSMSLANAKYLQEIRKTYKKDASQVEALYRDLHRYPELSGQEFKTAAKMAKALKEIGFDVTEKVGGTGLVGLFKNGQGPTVWLRADMDGLPITEETGKEYSSQNKGVMHACGHDTHMAAMVGYAKVLVAMKDQWKGTLVLIGQPAEEIVAGAKAMIDDGLYKRFPKPDYVLGFHVGGDLDAGEITYTEGYALAASDQVNILVKGYGGHGSTPHKTIDPIVLASKIVVSLQTLASRNIDPKEPVVLSIGSIHSGTKGNIIPNEVKMEGTLRSYSPQVRKKMKKRIRDLVKYTAKAEGAKEPKVWFEQPNPATFNNIALSQKIVSILKTTMDPKKVKAEPGIMGAEDFAHYSREGKYPTFFYFVGGAPKNRKNYGMNHNSKFAPVYKKVLAVGVETMALSAIQLFNDRETLQK